MITWTREDAEIALSPRIRWIADLQGDTGYRIDASHREADIMFQLECERRAGLTAAERVTAE